MKLKFVTITGADDSVQPHDLVKLSEKYPCTEWGILLSENQMGKSRFPSSEWMNKLVDFAPRLNLAGHLCGKWLRGLMKTGDLSFAEKLSLWPHFKRIQLNFHAEPVGEINGEALASLRKQTWEHKKKFIVQMDGVNNDLWPSLSFAGVAAYGLFDTSHGAGVLPKNWPSQFVDYKFDSDDEVVPSINPRSLRGYAGGLSPTNLAEQLEKLEKVVGEDEVWIDMETHVRSNNDKQFDLKKVEECLKIANKYVLK